MYILIIKSTEYYYLLLIREEYNSISIQFDTVTISS